MSALCIHPRPSVIVWNDIVWNEQGSEKRGRLTVTWCQDCGAVKRDFPNMKIDWERPALWGEPADDMDKTG